MPAVLLLLQSVTGGGKCRHKAVAMHIGKRGCCLTDYRELRVKFGTLRDNRPFWQNHQLSPVGSNRQMQPAVLLLYAAGRT